MGSILGNPLHGGMRTSKRQQAFVKQVGLCFVVHVCVYLFKTSCILGL